MNVKKVGDTLLVRIDRGEEIVKNLLQVAEDYNIQLASVSAIGAVGHVVYGVFDVSKKLYHSITKDGEMEVLSLLGNLTRKDGQPYLHLHITLSDKEGGAFGGHLNEAVISGTSEIFVRVVEGGEMDREYDDVTGLNLWKF